MIKLSKAQQDKIVAIAIGAVMLMVVVWWFGVHSADSDLAKLKKDADTTEKKLSDARALVKRSDEIGGNLQAKADVLAKREASLAPERDAYAWLINTINSFLQTRKGINIDSYSQPSINDMGMFAKFPYKWATFNLRGSGYYEEIGKFISDFENAFPYFIIQNVNITINSGAAMEAEKLSFTFDLVAPVASTPSETK